MAPSTNRGSLSIFPDGASLLVDAGDGNAEPPNGARRAPNGSRTPFVGIDSVRNDWWAGLPDLLGDVRLIDTHVKRIREKLGAAGGLISTVRGVGYRVDRRAARRL